MLRGLLSIPVALILGAAIHVDWHMARPHDHGGLSGNLAYHWLIALPVFGLAAWYLSRRTPRPVAAGVVTIATAVLLAQVLEPLGEHVLYDDPLSEVFAHARVAAFAAFTAAGVATYGVVTWLLSRRPAQVPS